MIIQIVQVTYSSNDDYIASIKDIPSQLFFIEKLEGTLEDLLEDFKQLDTNIILFHVSFKYHSHYYIYKNIIILLIMIFILIILCLKKQIKHIFIINIIIFTLKSRLMDIFSKLLILDDPFLHFIIKCFLMIHLKNTEKQMDNIQNHITKLL